MDSQRIHLIILLLVLTVACLTTMVRGRALVDKVEDEGITRGQLEGQKEDKNNNSSSSIIEENNHKDRIGLTVNKAQAHAIGAYGGQSLSQATTYGLQVGIVRPGQQYQQLHSSTRGSSNSFSSGPGAPKTWANSKSHVGGGPGHIGGGGSSGFSGGRGTATSNSYSVLHKIQQFDGTILYSNFKNTTKLDDGTVVVDEPGQSKDNLKPKEENGQLLFGIHDEPIQLVDDKKKEEAKFVFETK